MWAQEPAWGYFSKPPLIAWLIGGAQGLCGTGAACVRAPSTLAWAVTALAVFGVAASLGGTRAAMWAGLCALLAPGAAFSARIASTDAPLLMFWALTLLALVRLRAGGGRGWLSVLAAGLGLGLLSKYAMAYWLGCLAVAAAVDPATRVLLRRPDVWLALAGGLLLVAPNLIWNLDHGGVTWRHTADNATGEGWRFQPSAGLGFVAAQFVLAGPVVFGLMGAALARARGLNADARLCLAFSAPILLALTVLAFAGRAHANWAATGFIALFVLAGLLMVHRRIGRWLVGGLAFGILMQALLLVGDAMAPRLEVGRAYDRVLGWEAMAGQVEEAVRGQGVSVVVAETRADAVALIHGMRDRPIAVRVWPAAAGRAPRDHFEMSRPLEAASSPVLAVSTCPGPERFVGFARVAPVGEIAVPTSPGRERRRWLYRLEGGDRVVRPAACATP